jgi:hypothetical protein
MKLHTTLFGLLRMPAIRGSFEKLVDWRQCAVVMQRETVNVMANCSGGGIM